MKDDGCGLDQQENEDAGRGHYGLIGMQERAAAKIDSVLRPASLRVVGG